MEEVIRARMHEALGVVQPDTGMRARVMSSLPAHQRQRHGLTARNREWAIAAVTAILTIAIVAGMLFIQGPRVPREPDGHAVGQASSIMVTPKKGWVLTGSGLYHTIDGGFHWSNVTPLSAAGDHISPYYLDGSRAWLITSGASEPVVVSRTGDGGATWQVSRPITVIGAQPGLGGDVLFFLDRTRGWLLLSALLEVPPNGLVQTQFLFRTTDGGLTWNEISSSQGQADGCAWSSLTFSSPETGWISTYCPRGGGSALLVSHDGGTSWSAAPLPGAVRSVMPGSLVFFDSSHGFFTAEGTTTTSWSLLVTSDGGASWTVRKLPGEALISVTLVDPQHGWAIAGTSAQLSKFATPVPGASVPLYRTDDGGATWVPVETNLPLESAAGRVNQLNFVDPQNGFAQVFAASTQVMTMFHTSDAGHTWTPVSRVP